jgi:DNA-binding NarL/FixJ family response regulator/signal transduction histidine kinase
MSPPPIDYSELDPNEVFKLDFDALGRRMAAILKRVVDHDCLRVCLFHEQQNQLEVRFIDPKSCESWPAFGQGTTLPLRDSLPGEAVIAGHPIVRSDIGREAVHPDERFLPSACGVRSMLAVPLLIQGRTIGTLDLASKEQAAFGESAIQLVQDIACHAAVVLERVRLLDEARELARIEERKRLAREVHDAVMQSLVSVLLELELAERRLQSDVEAARLEIERACELVRQCLDEGRRLILNLRPAGLERLSVSDAVAHEVETLEAAGIEVHFSLEGSPTPVPQEVEIALYRIAQESVANIRRHAGAGKVTASLRFGPETARLLISDDGAGFDAVAVLEGTPEGGRLGLMGARERARAVGGDLWVESSSGRGTSVTVQVPLAKKMKTVETPAGRSRLAKGSPIRVLVVDDHEVVRQGVREILNREAGIEVVGEAADGGEALAKTRDLRPDVAIVDVQLPGMSGIELVSALPTYSPATRSLVLSAHRGGDLVLQAMKAGAYGYLLKDMVGSALAEAVRAVHRGERPLHPAAGSDLAARVGGLTGEVANEGLTSREEEVLHLIASGLRNKEIARQLTLTEATVKYHVAHLLGKLGVNGRTEALLKAQSLGLIRPGLCVIASLAVAPSFLPL